MIVRQKECPFLLPGFVGKLSNTLLTSSSEALLDMNQITDQLKAAGFDVARFLQAPGYIGGLTHRHSWVESGLRTSATDLNTYSTEVDSINSSPGLQKVSIISLSSYQRTYLPFVVFKNQINFAETSGGGTDFRINEENSHRAFRNQKGR